MLHPPMHGIVKSCFEALSMLCGLFTYVCLVLQHMSSHTVAFPCGSHTGETSRDVVCQKRHAKHALYVQLQGLFCDACTPYKLLYEE